MRSLILVISIFFLMCKSYAEEKPVETSTQGAESRKSGEFAKLVLDVQALQGKIKFKKDLVEKLILEKKEAKAAAKSSEVFEMLKLEHKELLSAIEQLNKLQTQIRYRFPEKDKELQLQQEKAWTIQEIENQMTLEGQMDSSLEVMRNQYGDTHKKVHDGELDRTKSQKENGRIILSK